MEEEREERVGTPEGPDGKTEAHEEEQEPKGYGFYALLHDFVYIFAAVTIIFVFAIRLVGVSGDSMYPTLHHADYLCLLSNVLYRDIRQGDVVVVTVDDGQYENEPIVKRVIATGGQTVDIDFDEGIVYVDGEPLDEPYINEPTYLSYQEVGLGQSYPLTVAEGSLFVMGDNRNHSADSRYAPIGPIDEREVLGKVLCVLLPGRGAQDGGESRYEDCKTRDFKRIGIVS